MEIALLNVFSVVPFRRMTFPSYQRLLQTLTNVGPQVAYGARVDGRPVGLALAELDAADASRASLLSVFVDHAHRGRGVATALVRAVQGHLAALGRDEVEASFVGGGESTPALRVVLARCGWGEPVATKWTGRGLVADMVRAPFMRRFRLPTEFDVVPWVSLDAAQREQVARLCDEGWAPPALVPFRSEACLDPVTSLALRHRGEVVGWGINQILRPGVLTYACSYVHPRWLGRGHLIGVYVESIRRHHQLLPEHPRGTLVVPHEFPRMVEFARRHLGPHLQSTSEFVRASVRLEHAA